MNIKSLLPALAVTVSLQLQGAAAFSAVSLSPPRTRLSASARLPVRAASFGKDTSNGVGPLMSTASGGEDAKVEGRKKRVILGYKAMMWTYLAVGINTIVRSGIQAPTLLLLSGFIALPAGLSYILTSAAKNDRLGSDTYKRINLSMLEYGLIGISVIALGGNAKRNALLLVSFILSIVNTIKGYAYGVLGWDKNNPETTLVKDLVEGTKSTIKGFLAVPKNVKSAGYLAATAFVASLKLLKVKEIFVSIQASAITSELAPLLARFNRLSLTALMLYTLKDAADRDRLGGTTFIELNYLCALSSVANYFLYSSSGGLTTPVGALSAFFAAFCAVNGITSSMNK